ncbi:hypothetical protein [Glaesserella parasuis]|uniref:hypothetical protein n=1 Tax=Glaesserella parasuis TaxID=738 RepID=UPI001F2224E4|nr:hypothetical protein [Glaesserella parasuis]
MTLSSQDKPKQSLNSRIAYALTDRKILHFRYDAHLRQQVMKQLSKTQRELLNRLAAAGVDALPKKQLDTLLKELKQEVAKVYQEMTAYTQDELSGFLRRKPSIFISFTMMKSALIFLIKCLNISEKRIKPQRLLQVRL